MSLFSKIRHLKAQIIETKRLYDMVQAHPLMSESFLIRLNSLQNELDELPKELDEPKIQLLFSGNATMGSLGVKSSFLGKTLPPFQGMVKTQAALHRFGRVGERGRTKKGVNSDLYLTALPAGSYGVELSQLKSEELFDSVNVAKAMKDVIALIDCSASTDTAFEACVERTPKRNLANLKKFLQEIVEEKSFLKMECGEIGIELSESKVVEAFQRVASTEDETDELFVDGTFRGLLLDSGRFEILDDNGKRLSGFISEELDEEQLVQYDKLFLNKECMIHLKVHKTSFKTGSSKIDYELLEILSK